MTSNRPNHAAPVATDAAASTAGATPILSADDPSSLLIVEDALIHSTIIRCVADKVQFITETAACVEDACALLRTRQFDCITLDLRLDVGRQAGAAMLRHLSDIRCKARIIIISGSAKAACDETVRYGKSLGLNICRPVPKPINLETLRDALVDVRMQSWQEKFDCST